MAFTRRTRMQEIVKQALRELAAAESASTGEVLSYAGTATGAELSTGGGGAVTKLEGEIPWNASGLSTGTYEVFDLAAGEVLLQVMLWSKPPYFNGTLGGFSFYVPFDGQDPKEIVSVNNVATSFFEDDDAESSYDMVLSGSIGPILARTTQTVTAELTANFDGNQGTIIWKALVLAA